MGSLCHPYITTTHLSYSSATVRYYPCINVYVMWENILEYLIVSLNGGTPKWMVYKGNSSSTWFGVPLFQETSIFNLDEIVILRHQAFTRHGMEPAASILRSLAWYLDAPGLHDPVSLALDAKSMIFTCFWRRNVCFPAICTFIRGCLFR